MKIKKCFFFLLVILTSVQISLAQPSVVTCTEDSCILAFEKDTFIIKYLKGDPTQYTGYYGYKAFFDSCNSKFSIKNLDDLKKLDSIKLKPLIVKLKGSDTYSYLIIKSNQPIPPPPPPPTSPTSNNKFKLLVFFTFNYSNCHYCFIQKKVV